MAAPPSGASLADAAPTPAPVPHARPRRSSGRQRLSQLRSDALPTASPIRPTGAPDALRAAGSDDRGVYGPKAAEAGLSGQLAGHAETPPGGVNSFNSPFSPPRPTGTYRQVGRRRRNHSHLPTEHGEEIALRPYDKERRNSAGEAEANSGALATQKSFRLSGPTLAELDPAAEVDPDRRELIQALVNNRRLMQARRRGLGGGGRAAEDSPERPRSSASAAAPPPRPPSRHVHQATAAKLAKASGTHHRLPPQRRPDVQTLGPGSSGGKQRRRGPSLHKRSTGGSRSAGAGRSRTSPIATRPPSRLSSKDARSRRGSVSRPAGGSGGGGGGGGGFGVGTAGRSPPGSPPGASGYYGAPQYEGPGGNALPRVYFGPTAMAPEWDDGDGSGAVLQQWMQSYATEQGSFASTVVELRALLARARVFSEPLGRPNRLLVAVAFHILDRTSHLYSRYSELMTDVRRIIRDAVYLPVNDAEALLHNDADAVGHPDIRSVDLGDGVDAVHYYYDKRLPYFRRTQALQRERQEMLKVVTDLQAAVASVQARMEQLRASVGTRQWKMIAKRMGDGGGTPDEAPGWDFAPTLTAVNSIRSNLVAWSKRHLDPVETVVRSFFEELSPKQQRFALLDVLSRSPHKNCVASMEILFERLMSPDDVLNAVAKWIQEAPDEATMEDLQHLVSSVLGSSRVQAFADDEKLRLSRAQFLLASLRASMSERELRELVELLVPDAFATKDGDTIVLTPAPRWEFFKDRPAAQPAKTRVVIQQGGPSHVFLHGQAGDGPARSAAKPKGDEGDESDDDDDGALGSLRSLRLRGRGGRRGSRASRRASNGSVGVAAFLPSILPVDEQCQTSPRLMDEYLGEAVAKYNAEGGEWPFASFPPGALRGSGPGGAGASDWGDGDGDGDWGEGTHGRGRGGRMGGRGRRGADGDYEGDDYDGEGEGKGGSRAAGAGGRRGQQWTDGSGGRRGGRRRRQRPDGTWEEVSDDDGEGGGRGRGRGRGGPGEGGEHGEGSGGRGRRGGASGDGDWSDDGEGGGRRGRRGDGEYGPDDGPDGRGRGRGRGRGPSGGGGPGGDDAGTGGSAVGAGSGAGSGAGAGSGEGRALQAPATPRHPVRVVPPHDAADAITEEQWSVVRELTRRLNTSEWTFLAKQLEGPHGFHFYVPGVGEQPGARLKNAESAADLTAAITRPDPLAQGRGKLERPATPMSMGTMELALAKSTRQVIVPTSWAKFTKSKGKKASKKKVRLANVLSLVFDCYEKKIVADSADDAVMKTKDSFITQRQPMPDFVYDFLMNKFGLATIAESNLRGIIDCILKKHRKSRRLHVFGMLCGVIEPQKYMPRMGDIILHIYKALFPKFSGATLRNQAENECFVLLSQAKAGLACVFKEPPSPINVETVELSPERYDRMMEYLESSARSYEDAVQAAAELKEKKEKKVKKRRSGYMQRTKSKVAGDSHSSKQYSAHEQVVSVDAIVDYCLDVLTEQRAEDYTALIRLFHQYDTDHNGILSLDEFGALVQVITTEDLTERDQMALFNQARDLQTTKQNMRSAASFNALAAKTEDLKDQLRAEEFATMCISNGITPNLNTAAPRRRRSFSRRGSNLMLREASVIVAGAESSSDEEEDQMVVAVEGHDDLDLEAAIKSGSPMAVAAAKARAKAETGADASAKSSKK